MKKDLFLHSPRNGKKGARGFGLIELIVSVAVVAVLTTVGVVVCGSVSKKSQMVKEVTAGRNLGVAYLAYAAENNGRLMRGYDKQTHTVTLPGGQVLDGSAAARYAFRLAPYFGFKIDDVLLVNEGLRKVHQEAASHGEMQYGYFVSLYSSFGINAHYVGGYMDDGLTLPPQEIATRLNQVTNPASMLVFASAKAGDVPGHCMVNAPRYVLRSGSSQPSGTTDWAQGDGADSRGYLDARHDGQVLCVFLDGSVKSMPFEELKGDMRLWSKQAAATDDVSYIPRTSGGNTGGGRG